jgi:hypothetical protein
MGPAIIRIESMEFSYPLEDIGTDEAWFNLVYEPDSITEWGSHIQNNQTGRVHVYE